MSEKSTRKAPDYAVEHRTAQNRSVFRTKLRRWSSHTAEERYNSSESGLKKEIPTKKLWRRDLLDGPRFIFHAGVEFFRSCKY